MQSIFQRLCILRHGGGELMSGQSFTWHPGATQRDREDPSVHFYVVSTFPKKVTPNLINDFIMFNLYSSQNTKWSQVLTEKCHLFGNGCHDPCVEEACTTLVQNLLNPSFATWPTCGIVFLLLDFLCSLTCLRLLPEDLTSFISLSFVLWVVRKKLRSRYYGSW